MKPDLAEQRGRVWGPSAWLTLTQERIDAFAAATVDQQWIHTDPERAERESPFGTTVAHGFLLLSLFPYFFAETVELPPMRLGINSGLDRLRFISPVPAGSRIRASFRLLDVEALPVLEGLSGEKLSWEVIVEREGIDKPACVASWICRRYFEEATPGER